MKRMTVRWKFVKEGERGESVYHKDIVNLYHAFMYLPLSLLFGIYQLPTMHSLLVTSDVINI